MNIEQGKLRIYETARCKMYLSESKYRRLWREHKLVGENEYHI